MVQLLIIHIPYPDTPHFLIMCAQRTRPQSPKVKLHPITKCTCQSEVKFKQSLIHHFVKQTNLYSYKSRQPSELLHPNHLNFTFTLHLLANTYCGCSLSSAKSVSQSQVHSSKICLLMISRESRRVQTCSFPES